MSVANNGFFPATVQLLISMKIPFVYLHAQYLTIKSEIVQAIVGVIRTSAYIRGPHVHRFEAGEVEQIS